MRTLHLATLAVTLAALQTGAARGAEPAPLAGVFSSIAEDPQTRAREGLQLDVRQAGWAEVLICQGECSVAISGPIRREGSEIAFEAVEPLVDPDGRREFQMRTAFRGRLTAEGIEIFDIQPAVLPPQRLTRRH